MANTPHPKPPDPPPPPPPPPPPAAKDPQDVKVALAEADLKTGEPAEPFVGIREEQLARSREMEKDMAGWVAAHDERTADEKAPAQVVGVHTPEPPPKHK